MLSEGTNASKVHFSLESIRCMIELLADRGQISETLLERRFGESARGFTETKSLLQALKVLISEKNTIKPGPKQKEMFDALVLNADFFCRLLARMITTSRGRFGQEARLIFRDFNVGRGEPEIWISAFESKYFAMRNLFIELGAIRIDHANEKYVIGTPFLDIFIEVRYSKGSSLKALSSDLTRKEELGQRTEQHVLKYEQEVVGQRYRHMIQHIAQENTTAGFDIASVRVNENTGRCRLRLIEVKAVSPRDWQFTFTMNEVRTATENKEAYFLYLVPVVRGEPVVNKMLVLQNPLDTLNDSSEWNIEFGDWRVCKESRSDGL